MTDRWSVSDDGLEPALLLYDGVVVAVFHQPRGLLNAKRTAEALNANSELLKAATELADLCRNDNFYHDYDESTAAIGRVDDAVRALTQDTR